MKNNPSMISPCVFYAPMERTHTKTSHLSLSVSSLHVFCIWCTCLSLHLSYHLWCLPQFIHSFSIPRAGYANVPRWNEESAIQAPPVVSVWHISSLRWAPFHLNWQLYFCPISQGSLSHTSPPKAPLMTCVLGISAVIFYFTYGTQ